MNLKGTQVNHTVHVKIWKERAPQRRVRFIQMRRHINLETEWSTHDSLKHSPDIANLCTRFRSAKYISFQNRNPRKGGLLEQILCLAKTKICPLCGSLSQGVNLGERTSLSWGGNKLLFNLLSHIFCVVLCSNYGHATHPNSIWDKRLRANGTNIISSLMTERIQDDEQKASVASFPNQLLWRAMCPCNVEAFVLRIIWNRAHPISGENLRNTWTESAKPQPLKSLWFCSASASFETFQLSGAEVRVPLIPLPNTFWSRSQKFLDPLPKLLCAPPPLRNNKTKRRSAARRKRQRIGAFQYFLTQKFSNLACPCLKTPTERKHVLWLQVDLVLFKGMTMVTKEQTYWNLPTKALFSTRSSTWKNTARARFPSQEHNFKATTTGSRIQKFRPSAIFGFSVRTFSFVQLKVHGY